MRKYLISTGVGELYNAASKARLDAERILQDNGYEIISFHANKTARGNPIKQFQVLLWTMKDCRNLFNQIENNSLIVLQYPHFPLKMVYFLSWLIPRIQKKKHVRFIALVHDLNSLRGLFGATAFFSDRRFLPEFDYIISHNKRMTEYLMNIGIPEEKITDLNLFDYLTKVSPRSHKKYDGLAIAGNLDPQKSGYISHLIRLRDKRIPIHLYGKGITRIDEEKNAFFHGAFVPEVLPGELEGAFGIVWDGPGVNVCEGKAGDYLQVNNPHKFSLFMAAGIPVIVWEKAALADLVREKEVGVTVQSLFNLQQILEAITEKEYKAMRTNVLRIGEAVRNGKYLTAAIKTVEEKLEGIIQCEANIRKA